MTGSPSAVELLEPLIAQAEREGKWLYVQYDGGLWFSPAKLRQANAEGRFRWGLCNWRLRNPNEYLEENKEQIARLVRELDALKEYTRNLAKQIGAPTPECAL